MNGRASSSAAAFSTERLTVPAADHQLRNLQRRDTANDGGWISVCRTVHLHPEGTCSYKGHLDVDASFMAAWKAIRPDKTKSKTKLWRCPASVGIGDGSPRLASGTAT